MNPAYRSRLTLLIGSLALLLGILLSFNVGRVLIRPTQRDTRLLAPTPTGSPVSAIVPTTDRPPPTPALPTPTVTATPQASPTVVPPTAENEALARRFHVELVQQGNLAVADEIIAPDFVLHPPGLLPAQQRGPAAAKQLAVLIRSVLSDVQLTQDDTISAGDTVVVRWRARGTHTGAILGIAPTGKPITLTGIDSFRITDGKVVELWQYWDQLGLLQQLGAVSPPD